MLRMIVSRTLFLHKNYFHTEKAKIGKTNQSSQLSNSGNAASQQGQKQKHFEGCKTASAKDYAS